MSWQLATGDLPWIEEHYIKKESNHNFQVKCISCQNHIKYAKVRMFKKHIRIEHSEEYIMECEMQCNRNVWKYFILTKKGNTRCIVCKIVMLGKQSKESLEYHLSEYHENEEELKPYDTQNWAWKYVDAEEVNNFFGKCTLCNTKMRFPLMSKKLILHLKEDGIKVNDKRNVQLWKDQIDNLYWLHNFYAIAEKDFQAECKTCGHNYFYVSIKTIKDHMRKHKNIFDYEQYMQKTEKRTLVWKGMRFIDNNARVIECMGCQEILKNKFFINNHKTHHKPLLSYQIYWGFKYMKQLGDLAKCTICEEDVKLVWHANHLKSHIKNQHEEIWTTMNAMYQQVIPSTSQAA
nr:PREDICTED: uncharacterized protein LOC105673084 [Linepithema humile]